MAKRPRPAKQVVFLNRKLGGMFHLLKDADASLDLHEYLVRVTSLDLQHASPKRS